MARHIFVATTAIASVAGFASLGQGADDALQSEPAWWLIG